MRTLLPLSSAFARAAGEGFGVSFELSKDLDPRWRSSDSDILIVLLRIDVLADEGKEELRISGQLESGED
jgi:hypothetical protein